MRDVIEAIDNALDDWDTSDDAMRWTPEQAPEPLRRAATFGQVMGEGYRRSAVWSPDPHLHGELLPDMTLPWRRRSLEEQLHQQAEYFQQAYDRQLSQDSVEGPHLHWERLCAEVGRQYIEQYDFNQRAYGSVITQDSDVSLMIQSID